MLLTINRKLLNQNQAARVQWVYLHPSIPAMSAFSRSGDELFRKWLLGSQKISFVCNKWDTFLEIEVVGSPIDP